MRQGHNNNKRMRGRSRKGPNPLSRSYESNGPDVKIRGNALHVAEKYVTLARDAASAGDRVAEQNYLQHAEHYYRIVAAAQAQMPQAQPFQRPDTDGDDDNEMGDRDDAPNERGQDMRGRNDDHGDRPSFDAGQGRQPYGLSEPQPYSNGRESNGHDESDDSDDDGNEAEIGVSAEPTQPPRRRRSSRPRGPRSETPVPASETVSSAEE